MVGARPGRPLRIERAIYLPGARTTRPGIGVPSRGWPSSTRLWEAKRIRFSVALSSKGTRPIGRRAKRREVK